jgi:hypothetical protein
MADNDPKDVGESDTRSAEDVAKREDEAGREDLGEKGPMDRPVGTSTARDVTGVDPQEPIAGDGTWTGGGDADEADEADEADD